jgi:hypothetical protein
MTEMRPTENPQPAAVGEPSDARPSASAPAGHGIISPAGWHPDPQRGHLLRWWDGTQWTSATRAVEQAVDPVPRDPRSRRQKWKAAAIAAVVILVAIGAAYAVKQYTRSDVCKEYCAQAEDLNSQKCTDPAVHTCATLLDEKVALAAAINEMTVSEEEMSFGVERIHHSAGMVESAGRRWSSGDCSEMQTGGKLFRCRTIATDLDGDFSELVERVQSL